MSRDDEESTSFRHRAAEFVARMETDKASSKEVTETFIKDSDPVRVETDRVSKITYTIKIGEDKVCINCDTHIEMGCAYISKKVPMSDMKGYSALDDDFHTYTMCLECGCKHIKGMKDRSIESIPEIDTSLWIDNDTYRLFHTVKAWTDICLEYKMHMKIIDEVKEMTTDRDREDYDEREGLEALFGDSPTHDEEHTPDEEVEIEEPPAPHIPTVMSKLTGSVDMPEEFKFADSTVFYTMLRNIFRGKSILVTGPSGCGKSSLGKILADITNKPYYAFNFGDTMNPAAKILGDTKYSKEEGTFFKKSRFVSALQNKDGAFIMLDEVTRDRTGDLANILMPVLDGQKYLALDESDDSDTVEIEPNAFFYATANIGREYLGAAHDLDRAWKDRFTGGIYELEYLPQKKEQELLMIRSPSLSEDDGFRITDFAKRVRDLYKAEEISTAVSTRMCLSTAEFVVDGMTLIDALKQVCLPFYPVVAGDDSERVQIIQTIQSMGD